MAPEAVAVGVSTSDHDDLWPIACGHHTISCFQTLELQSCSRAELCMWERSA